MTLYNSENVKSSNFHLDKWTSVTKNATEITLKL